MDQMSVPPRRPRWQDVVAPGLVVLPQTLAQLPVFSANTPPAHAPGKGPQSLAGVPPPGDVQGRSGH
jgi:hypothetical protein